MYMSVVLLEFLKYLEHALVEPQGECMSFRGQTVVKLFKTVNTGIYIHQTTGAM